MRTRRTPSVADDVTDAQSAFTSNGQPRGEFLIFRLKIEEVIVIE